MVLYDSHTIKVSSKESGQGAGALDARWSEAARGSCCSDLPAVGPHRQRCEHHQVARGPQQRRGDRAAQRQVQRRTGVTVTEWRASVAPYIEQQLATGRYPNLQRAISSGGDLDNHAAFEFIMNFILDAVAVRPPKRRR